MLTLARLACCAAGLAAAALAAWSDPAAAQRVIRVGQADTLTGHNLPELIAMTNTEKRLGVKFNVVALKSDDVVFQAVINNEIDIGIGDAYKGIDTLKAPVRHFFLLRRVAYFPVVNSEAYKTWKDLNGADMAVHARGSATEALALQMEKANGIKFGQISFVPGSEVRIIAMRRGTMKATLLDLPNTRKLTEEDPKKFIVLPVETQSASDEIFYATTKFIADNKELVQVLSEELLKSLRAVNADPKAPARLRTELGLLKDLPKPLADDITPYFEMAVPGGLFPTDGGGAAAAKADFDFLIAAGRFKGQNADYKVEDFWELAPLNAALAKVGKN
ncbi:ABC transporter substrate-binding protein [Rhodoplanes sp. SY1]|uniref:ABC transporter substrate-binding protein n=1 Tax=Rhodoplanes sp. SY1 TaxID=3166646 RepID=UPI0038B58B6F